MRAQDTPKTLDEALLRIMTEPLMNLDQDAHYGIMRDFIANKFATAYLWAKDDPRIMEILQPLFQALTDRSSNPKDHLRTLVADHLTQFKKELVHEQAKQPTEKN